MPDAPAEADDPAVHLLIEGVLLAPRPEVEALVRELIDVIRRTEPGTLIYSWYFAEREERVLIEERYADSDAFLSHMADLRRTDALRRLGQMIKAERTWALSGGDARARDLLGRLAAIYWRPVATLEPRADR